MMEYVTAYHLHCGLPLLSGRRVVLEALHLWMTCAGWILGMPSRESNDRAIARSAEEAVKYGVPGSRPYLLPPRRRDYLREPGDMDVVRAVGEVPEWLPVVTCVGVFKDVFPARDPAKDQSYLTVVWYQDEFAPPVEKAIFAQLQSLDWEALATDVEL